MHIFVEENWICSQQALTRPKSTGFSPEMAARYKARSGSDRTASGCGGTAVLLKCSDETAPTGAVLSILKIESMGNKCDNNIPQVLTNPVPEVSFTHLDGNEIETDESEVQITLAPPEKWADPDFMEDGEISGVEEGDGEVVVAGYLPGWQQNSEGVKRSREEVEKEKLPNRKRQRLDWDAGDCPNRQSTSSARELSKTPNLSKSGRGDRCTEQSSFLFSRLAEPNLSNRQGPAGDQDTSPQYDFSADVSLDELINSSLESGSSQEGDSSEDQFTLVPLLRSIIEAQRKKTTELEGENNLLKSLFAKTLSEKNEALEMLRKSNQTLKKVTTSSVELADEVKSLKTQLAEKDAQIKILRIESFTIRDCVGRMGRTFLKLQEMENQTAGRCSGEEDPKTEDTHKQDLKKDGKGKTRTESDKVPKSPAKCPAKPTRSRRSLTLEEMYIINKLADLNKWKYSIRDIRWVDGEYKCPECGMTRKSLEAVAAHARDKHVWQHGAKFGQNRDRRSD